jgi:dienelactone hydrolase
MRRAVIGVIAALVAGALAPMSVASAQPTSSAAANDATRPRYAVGVRVIPFEDTSRATPADPEATTPADGAPTRALPTTVYYPAQGPPAALSGDGADVAVADAPPAPGKFPVIFFSHGAPGSPHDYSGTLQRWAAEGYAVVAPTYPVTTRAGITKVTVADQREQVRDAEYVLDHVLVLDRTPVADGGLGGLLDPKRIAAAGHSMGGLTTLALVSRCCRDPRIKAAVVLAGVSVNHGGPKIHHPSGPILFAHALYDVAVPFQESQLAYRGASDPKYLLQVRFPVAGVVAHLLPFFPGYGSTWVDVGRVVDQFLAGYLAGDRSARPGIAEAAHTRFLHLNASP